MLPITMVADRGNAMFILLFTTCGFHTVTGHNASNNLEHLWGQKNTVSVGDEKHMVIFHRCAHTLYICCLDFFLTQPLNETVPFTSLEKDIIV